MGEREREREGREEGREGEGGGEGGKRTWEVRDKQKKYLTKMLKQKLRFHKI